ncbi:ABC transporter ATP-binding protein [Photobacterium rosenbergii]|uniref:ABC transporter ATP-binding protein n=1 Tax=Photobacterium rosenbergii TaxID=294936 RepID=UPI001C9A12D9|nr:ABC transporter ATP-binding protein [Photobacterium rosenbergii]MBY5946630.1 ABC transporter ATP-binding protein [Photobacterium rosenbergii]
MGIQINHFTKTFGDTTVIDNMNLDIGSGEMIALLGPSGCGKSTTLFAISGIHKIDGGSIVFAGKDVTKLPPEERNVGVIFQSYALYPHMTVEQNIAFPLMIRKESKAEIKRKVEEIAKLVRIDNLLHRKPAELSGGQQQRVSLARAIVRKPDVLLLDEPLANLDAKLRLEMRSEIRRIQQETGITAVLVTHDQVEAMSMCDRIAIMNGGKIVQVDTPNEMYHNPVNDFVAGFLGNPPISFIDGELCAGHFINGEDGIKLPLVDGYPENQAARIGLRPEHVILTEDSNEVTNCATVCFIENQGRENLYDLKLADGNVIRTIQPVRDDLKLGDTVHWSINAENILLFSLNGDRLYATPAALKQAS